MALDRSDSRGKFIVFEGGDSTGKHTQAKLLLKHLQLQNPDIELLTFPQYDTPFGSMVAKYLRGEYGSMDSLPPEIPVLLYALDRYQARDELEAGLSAGKWYIADRYTQSNFGYQGAKLEGEKRRQLITWIESVENRMPQPDLVLYLNVPVPLSQKLMATRPPKDYMGPDKVKDMHELDAEYQKRVVDTYLDLASDRDDWVVVDCATQDLTQLCSIEKIHKKIVEAVKDKIGV